MIVTNTDSVEGSQIAEYRGIVSGEAILGTQNSMLMVSANGTAVKLK